MALTRDDFCDTCLGRGVKNHVSQDEFEAHLQQERTKTQGLGRTIYSIELEDLFIMAALAGIARGGLAMSNVQTCAIMAVALGKATYQARDKVDVDLEAMCDDAVST